MKRNSDLKKFITSFGCGSFTGTFVQMIASPFYRLYFMAANYETYHKLEPKDKSLAEGIKRLIQQFKLNQFIKQSFWKLNFKRLFLTYGILFSTKDYLNKKLQKFVMTNQYYTKFLIKTFSGVIGGLVCLTVIYPMDYPRVMLVKMNGIKDFYKNFTINSIPYLINKGLYFGIFDSLKGNSPHQSQNKLKQLLLHAFTSSLISNSISRPFQKARDQFLKIKQYDINESLYRKYYLGFQKMMKLNPIFTFKYDIIPFALRIAVGTLNLMGYQMLMNYKLLSYDDKVQ